MNLKTIGRLELTRKEIEASVRLFLRDKFGIVPDKVTIEIPPESKIEVTFEVAGALPEQKASFQRKNLGFYKSLVGYLDRERSKRKKRISFEEAFKAMSETFPDLKERNFLIYILDKRQQEKKGFKYDNTADGD